MINKKVQKYIKDSSSKGSPWAAYYALTEAHTPLIVEKEFKGKSSHGAYGDTILQMDNMVGRVLDTLREAGKQQRAECQPYCQVGIHASRLLHIPVKYRFNNLVFNNPQIQQLDSIIIISTIIAFLELKLV